MPAAVMVSKAKLNAGFTIEPSKIPFVENSCSEISTNQPAGVFFKFVSCCVLHAILRRFTSSLRQSSIIVCEKWPLMNVVLGACLYQRTMINLSSSERSNALILAGLERRSAMLVTPAVFPNCFLSLFPNQLE